MYALSALSLHVFGNISTCHTKFIMLDHMLYTKVLLDMYRSNNIAREIEHGMLIRLSRGQHSAQFVLCLNLFSFSHDFR